MATTAHVETQHFRQWWVWIILVVSSAGAFGAMVSTGSPAWWASLLVLPIPLWLWCGGLTTRIAGGQVSVRLLWVFRTQFAAAEVVAAEETTFRPLRDCGGWGLRWGPAGCWYWTVSGDRGVLVTRAGGRRLVIGSQQPAALRAALLAAAQDAARGAPNRG